jgi:hypothetical protein
MNYIFIIAASLFLNISSSSLFISSTCFCI